MTARTLDVSAVRSFHSSCSLVETDSRITAPSALGRGPLARGCVSSVLGVSVMSLLNKRNGSSEHVSRAVASDLMQHEEWRLAGREGKESANAAAEAYPRNLRTVGASSAQTTRER